MQGRTTDPRFTAFPRIIGHIIRKELLGHLLSLRFIIGGLCCVAMILTSTYVLTRQYEDRLDAYREPVANYEERLSGLFAWVSGVLIFPGAASYSVERLSPLQSDEGVRAAADETHEELKRKEKAYLEERNTDNVFRGLARSSGTSNDDGPTGSGRSIHLGKIRAEKEGDLVLQRDFSQFLELARVESADRIWQIRKDHIERNQLRLARLAGTLSRISPAAAYEQAAAAAASTDLDAHQRFLDCTRSYRREWIQHLTDIDAFGSRLWFNADLGSPDVASIPRFQWQTEALTRILGRSLPNVAILAVWNALLFWAAVVIFAKRSAV